MVEHRCCVTPAARGKTFHEYSPLVTIALRYTFPTVFKLDISPTEPRGFLRVTTPIRGDYALRYFPSFSLFVLARIAEP